MEMDRQPAERPATSVDVARLAKVSQATVSYVLNDTPGKRIRPQTRDRVLAAAASLGYVPSASARTLRTGQSNLVLLPVGDIPFGQAAMGFVNQLTGRLRQLGYEAVIYAGDSALAGVQAAREWARWRPAAVLAEGMLLDEQAVGQLTAAGTRLIVGFGPAPSPLVPSLILDDAELGAAAARHLLSRHRAPLAVLMPASPALHPFAERRLAGVRQVAPDAVTFEMEYADDDAARVAALWSSGSPPGGVFAYNDEYAMLLMRYLQDAGLRIPDDVAVVGADDLPLCTQLRPRLTSVRMSPPLDGGAVADQIDTVLRGGRWEGWPSFAAELTARESS
jgi:DNA-binding LacI/PurR family transcriptional regulator